MKIAPHKLYSYYLNEMKKIPNEKLTQKKYNELRKIEKQLQKYGMLPINEKWKGL